MATRDSTMPPIIRPSPAARAMAMMFSVSKDPGFHAFEIDDVGCSGLDDGQRVPGGKDRFVGGQRNIELPPRPGHAFQVVARQGLFV